jgi:hypothetical protein
MKKETFVIIKEYDEEFVTSCRTGWGCGYVHIPKDHPILVQTLENDGWGNYLTPKDCPEEITYTEWDESKEYLIIGFDTGHSYNNFTHNEKYVTDQSYKIKDLVDAYTAEDARKYAQKKIEENTKLYSKYL